ncbi:MAG: zinc-dependent peptidase [Gammaproteobacteria bacterium]|nr:zinc-dependent peptidase [Gammaproteobacteria bacterium]
MWNLFAKPRAQPIDDDAWSRLLDRAPLLRTFSAHEQARLRERANEFLRDKGIDTAAGLELGDFERQLVAAFAAIPILELDIDWYDGWYAVIAYPDAFVAPHAIHDEAGVLHEGERELSGESWERGPLIVSWSDFQGCASGELLGNVLIHECAHKIDQLNGSANGFPPLHGDMSISAWTSAWQAAYDDLRRRVDRGEETDIDPYATEDPAEFFAVLSEYFFSEPDLVAGEFPAVYEQLRRLYRQDPANRPAPHYEDPDPQAP